MSCCCVVVGVLYAPAPPRGSASPPLSLSSSQGLRPPPRESITTQENCPPSAKHVHTFSQSYPLTQCRHELLPVTPWFFGCWGGINPRGLPDISSENSSGRSRPGERCPRRAGGRPSRPSRSTATATTGDPSRSATSARIGFRTRHLAEDDLVLASRRCFAMSMAAVAFEVFYLLDGTKTDDAGR